MKCVMLCGGFGTRLYPLTLDVAKPLLKVRGREIISYIIENLNSVEKIDEIIILSNKRFHSQFSDWLKNLEGNKKKIRIFDNGVMNNDNRLGGATDFALAVKEGGIDDDVLVLNTDLFFDARLENFVNFFGKHKKSCVWVFDIKDKEKAKRFGVIEIDNNKIVSVEEKPNFPKSTLVNAGAIIITKDDLRLLNDFLKTDMSKEGVFYFIEYLMKRGDVFGCIFDGFWYDIGTIEQYEELNKG